MLASSIITDVLTIFGDENQVQVTEADIIRWINDAQLQVVNKTECLIKDESPATPLVAGTARYAIPADFLKFKRVVVDGRTLDPAPAALLDHVSKLRHSSTNGETGSPRFYYREGGYVYLYPTPDYAYSYVLTYVNRPTAITAGSDSLTIREEYCATVKKLCLARAYELDDQFDQATKKEKEFEREVDEDIADEKNANADSYPSVRPVGDDWW